MSTLFRMVSLTLVLAAFFRGPARVSALGLPSTCAQPRAHDNAAMSPAGNGWTYLYTGGSVAKLWRWTGGRWLPAANASAPAVTSPALAPDSHGTGLILLGTTRVGADHRIHLGMWRWRDGRWSLLQPSRLPSAGYFQIELSLAQDRVAHTLLLSETVSNAAYGVHNELWSWDDTTWKRVASDEPGQITGSTVPNAIATGPGGEVYGFLGTMFHAERLVRWDGSTLEPVNVPGGPQAVAGITWNSSGGELLALGGDGAWIPDTPFPTYATYRFDGVHWTSTTLIPGLQNWFGMRLAPDQKHGDVVLWGGQRSYGFVRSHPKPAAFPATWKWSGQQWVQAGTSCRLER
jgi:hypothetical protein